MQCLKNNNNIIYSTLIKALKIFNDYYLSKCELQSIFKKIGLLYEDHDDAYSCIGGGEKACIEYYSFIDDENDYKTKFGKGVKQILKEELPTIYFNFHYDKYIDDVDCEWY